MAGIDAGHWHPQTKEPKLHGFRLLVFNKDDDAEERDMIKMPCFANIVALCCKLSPHRNLYKTIIIPFYA